MLNSIFNSVFETTTNAGFALPQFLECLGISILLGIFIAFVYNLQNKSTQSFTLTLAILPAVVAVVIMVVNGNVGAGVAVAGAFSLVRFRSAPGSAKEISMIFLAMACGLMCGMGYLAYAIVFAIVLTILLAVMNAIKFGAPKQSDKKALRISIPEDLNYSGLFDEIFAQYTGYCKLLSVKSTNMGSMFKLTYQITLKDEAQEKAFIDALRVRNGNLEIAISTEETTTYDL